MNDILTNCFFFRVDINTSLLRMHCADNVEEMPLLKEGFYYECNAQTFVGINIHWTFCDTLYVSFLKKCLCIAHILASCLKPPVHKPTFRRNSSCPKWKPDIKSFYLCKTQLHLERLNIPFDFQLTSANWTTYKKKWRNSLDFTDFFFQIYPIYDTLEQRFWLFFDLCQ